MSCEDFPACGHEAGCCPRFENGIQMDMVCVCGRRLPVDNPVSICKDCLGDGCEFDDSMDGDHESGLASAGWGTDEDYQHDTPMYEDYYGGE